MKKIFALILAAGMLMTSAASAYYFPEPDWGALLREKEEMVSQTDFELYTEGKIESAPYFGARLEPRGGTYLGMIAENAEDFKPLGSYLTYIQDMYQDDIYYPANRMVREDNVIPMIGWTINSVDGIDYNKVRQVLNTLNSFNKPMFIRFANEMNVSALGDEPDRYIEAFRKAADMIHEYPNFAVVWSPNDMGALDRPFEYFYPGDEYVDWVGVSCYSIRYFMGDKNAEYKSSVYFMTGDCAWATNRLKPIMEFMAKNGINKPVMISEGGVATGNKYGDYCDDWAAPRLRNMLNNVVMKYPQVKLINYFNTRRENETEWFDISGHAYAAEIFKKAAASGAYIREGGGQPEFVYRPANEGETLAAKNGIVNLYTLAYVRNQPDITVNYTLDGNWYHSSGAVPYNCALRVSDLADGQHTVSISAGGEKKDYTFYKIGSSIRFGAEPENVQPEICVKVDGNALSFDQPPIIDGGRTLVPLRAIFTALGAEVDWDGDTKTVTAQKDGKTVRLTVGSDKIYVAGTEKTLDVPAQIVGGRTLVPVRAISESFDCNVNWDGGARTVYITR